MRKGTGGGTETSKYPEEERQYLHSLSSGERKGGRSLNYVRVIVCRRFARGGVVGGADVGGFCRIPSDRKRSS